MGRNCLREVCKHFPERIIRIYTYKKEEAFIQGMPVSFVSKQKLHDLVDSESHQGFVAEVEERSNTNLKDFLKEDRERSVVLVLDSIFDPQNLGALLRAAECFGVDGVIWSKNRGVDVTPVVSKSSVGASELVNIMKVSNLVESIKKLKDAGYWVVTAEVDPEALSLYSFDFPEKTVLVIGSEGKGIQPLISKHSDFKVYIPMSGKIDSLNVSQATAVFLANIR